MYLINSYDFYKRKWQEVEVFSNEILEECEITVDEMRKSMINMIKIMNDEQILDFYNKKKIENYICNNLVY